MPLVPLTCPQCSAAVMVLAEQTQFVCQFCGAMIATETAAAPPSRPSPAEPLRQPVNLSRFTIEQTPTRLSVQWDWDRTMGIAWIVFDVLYGIGLVFLLKSLDRANAGGAPLAMIALMSGLLGPLLLYATVAHLLNRTEVVVERGVLQVKSGPIPWRLPQHLPVDRIRQLYVAQTRSPTRGDERRTYELHALCVDGPPLRLLRDEMTSDVPRAIERLLETHLGIEDRPVEGQL